MQINAYENLKEVGSFIMQRDYYIDFWRFVFALVIACMHGGIIFGGGVSWS